RGRAVVLNGEVADSDLGAFRRGPAPGLLDTDIVSRRRCRRHDDRHHAQAKSEAEYLEHAREPRDPAGTRIAERGLLHDVAYWICRLLAKNLPLDISRQVKSST